MTNNPFDLIDARLSNIESLLLDLKNPPKTEIPKDKTLIRRKEARELLGGISNPTIISYEKKGLVNPIRIGGTILYDRSDILNRSKRR